MLEIIDLHMAASRLADADMLLCNAALPDLTQLLPRLTEQAPRVPIIIVAGNHDTPRSIETGTKPLTDGETGLEVVRILEAAQQSIRKDGERVFLELIQ